MSMEVIGRDKMCGITTVLIRTEKWGIRRVEIWRGSDGEFILASYECEDGHTETWYAAEEVERHFPGILKLA